MPKIRVNGIDLFYDVAGGGNPLLLIHGLGSSRCDWEFQVDYFARNFRVITCDVRGFGESSKPGGPYSMSLFARDIAGLLNGLNTGPAHILGISMGGMIAFEFALDFPQLVKSLVIVNSYPEMRVENASERLMVMTRFLLLDLLGVRRMGIWLSKRLFIKPEQQQLRDLFVERWSKNDHRSYRLALKAIVGWDVESRLGGISCPTLVVASDEDYLPLEEKREYTRRISGAKLVVIKDARHAVTVEKPDQFNDIVWDFLNEVEGNG